MEVMMNFSNEYPDLLGTLPVIMPSYPGKLQPQEGRAITDSMRFYRDAEAFDGLFDAAALGQYIGGIDKIHNPGNTDGFVNPHSAYRWDQPCFKMNWTKDDLNRKYLTIEYSSANKKEEWKIYNLHIHSKELSRFIS
jgi:hypothetical protein